MGGDGRPNDIRRTPQAVILRRVARDVHPPKNLNPSQKNGLKSQGRFRVWVWIPPPSGRQNDGLKVSWKIGLFPVGEGTGGIVS